MGYNVAFRYTRKAGLSHGIVTWTSFASKEDFDKWYTPELRAIEDVAEEGITEERAIQLVNETPFACRIAAAIERSRDSDGFINFDRLKYEVATAAFAESEAIRDEVARNPKEETEIIVSLLIGS